MVVILKTTVRIICKCGVFYPNTLPSMGDIDVWIERLVMLEHAVSDPQDFMHTDAHRGYIVLYLFPRFWHKLFSGWRRWDI